MMARFVSGRFVKMKLTLGKIGVLVGLLALLNVNSLAAHAQTNAKEIKRIGNGIAHVAAWSPDDKVLAVGTSLSLAFMTPDLKVTTPFDSPAPIMTLVWNPNGKQIAASHAR